MRSFDDFENNGSDDAENQKVVGNARKTVLKQLEILNNRITNNKVLNSSTAYVMCIVMSMIVSVIFVAWVSYSLGQRTIAAENQIQPEIELREIDVASGQCA